MADKETTMPETTEETGPSDEEISAIFKEFDTSGDGFIDLDELQKALAKAGKNVSKEECESILKQVDENNDGQISLEEFKAVFKLAPDQLGGLAVLKDVGGIFMKGIGALGEGAVKVSSAVADGAVAGATAVGEGAAKVGSAVADGAVAGATAVGEGATKVGSAVADGAVAGATAVGGAVTSGASAVGGAVTGAAGAVTDVVSKPFKKEDADAPATETSEAPPKDDRACACVIS